MISPSRTKIPATAATVLVASANPCEAAETATSVPGCFASSGMICPADACMALEICAVTCGGAPAAVIWLVVKWPNPMSSVVPRMAVPMAAPICRAVDCTALAEPESFTGTSDKITPVNGAVAKPTPSP